MMKNLFADIFRSLLLSLKGPPPGFLVNLILEYVEICFNIAKKEDIDALLRITVHFLKHVEYTPANHPFFERILAKVVQSAPKLTKIIEEDTTEFFLEIIEEFILVGLDSRVFDYRGYINSLYTTLSTTVDECVPIETIFKLKACILSVHTTLLLSALEKKTFMLSDFEVK